MSRSSANGDTKLQIDTTPLSANSLATSATRRMFSSRSVWLNPRFLFKPVRTLSPSSPYAGMPRDTRNASSSKAIEVFPAPENPVSQTVQPRKPLHRPKFWPRKARVTWCFCSVTFVATCRHWNEEGEPSDQYKWIICLVIRTYHKLPLSGRLRQFTIIRRFRNIELRSRDASENDHIVDIGIVILLQRHPRAENMIAGDSKSKRKLYLSKLSRNVRATGSRRSQQIKATAFYWHFKPFCL